MTVNQKVEKLCYYLAVMLSIRAFFRDNLSLTKNKIETKGTLIRLKIIRLINNPPNF